MASQPQCDLVVWQRKEVTACPSRVRGRLNLLDCGVGRHRTRLRDGAKMWQWGNSVTAYCVMSPRFLTYCEGDERKKMASNGFSIWWKGAPADRASVSLFLKTGWQRMRRERRKNGWAQREISGLLFSCFFFIKKGVDTERVGGCCTYSFTPAIKYLSVVIYTVIQSVQGLII